MSHQEKKKYQTLKELPGYPAGTVICHQFAVHPSRFRDGDSYATDGTWYIDDEHQSPIPGFLKDLVRWCAGNGNPKYQGWIEELE